MEINPFISPSFLGSHSTGAQERRDTRSQSAVTDNKENNQPATTAPEREQSSVPSAESSRSLINQLAANSRLNFNLTQTTEFNDEPELPNSRTNTLIIESKPSRAIQTFQQIESNLSNFQQIDVFA